VVALEAGLVSRAQFAGMVLYEPPVAVTESLGGEALIRGQSALAAGDPGLALEIHLRQIVRVSDHLVRLLRLVGPLWHRMAASTPAQIQDDANLESLGVGIGRYAHLNLPVLLLGGARSPERLRTRLDSLASVLPDLESVVVLPHQGHLANVLAPRRVAQIVELLAARSFR
jgi:pimeloyl-ACP methyl ester carboxylesterase